MTSPTQHRSAVCGSLDLPQFEAVFVSGLAQPFVSLCVCLPAISAILLSLMPPRWLCGEGSTCQCRRCNTEEAGSIPGSRRLPGEGKGNPLQCSSLEMPMDRGAWWAAVHGVAEGRTRLSDFTLTFHFHALEKELATHSNILAWRIPGMGEPGGLPSMGSHRVRHD